MSNPMEQFEIKPLIPLNIGGVDVSFTNSSLFMVLAVVSAVLLMGMCLRKRTIIPSVAQSVPEVLYEFIAGLLRDKDDETTLIPEVEVSEIEGYKAAGIIAGGMIPKIGGMADAIYQGVHEAVIIDGRVPHSILLEMFSDRGAGTMFYRRGNR